MQQTHTEANNQNPGQQREKGRKPVVQGDLCWLITQRKSVRKMHKLYGKTMRVGELACFTNSKRNHCEVKFYHNQEVPSKEHIKQAILEINILKQYSVIIYY